MTEIYNAATHIAGACGLMATLFGFALMKYDLERFEEEHPRTAEDEARMRDAIAKCRDCARMVEYRGCVIDHKVSCAHYAVSGGECPNHEEVE